jgi:hypothetical protein
MAYKLFRVRKDGTIGSLFINRSARHPVNEWLMAECHPTNGYAVRPYWHCTSAPEAPHLSTKGRKWYVVEIENYEVLQRPMNQGGLWYLAGRIKIISEIQ